MIIVRRTRPAKSALFATYALPEGRRSKGDDRKQRRATKTYARRGYERGWQSLDRDLWTGNPSRVIRVGGESATPTPKSYTENLTPRQKELTQEAERLRQKLNDSFKETQERVNQKVHVEPPKFNLTEKDVPKKIPTKLLLAGLGVTGLVGAGAFFTRRRRSKNGKIVVEQVRRKA